MADSRTGTDTAALARGLSTLRASTELALGYRSVLVDRAEAHAILAEIDRLSVALEAARQERDLLWTPTDEAPTYEQALLAELAWLREERDEAIAEQVAEYRMRIDGEIREARLREELRELQEGRETEIGGNRVARSGGES